ncbi:uncharacterized protein K444DRAFT_715137 [Hyaloscypha bicolor E]|uniref:Sacsin/Nov domain-containing protein n=1 Tax=Hyaloscypha bicolor E TaxID=1095630 RepID=A0A2J6TLE5_9HELO|nr:uncharacterized protein K444DRAFT_715137 [Hyaloscypha bicolor E]PMD63840.1 hypothetical protein K444DRAFT_715137 [Hyaloscypha bicolor E]
MLCGVSRDIYTSVDSVVLELIQNADDATYGYAESENCTPYLKFALLPGKVILEYNEDGFTRDDVNRICDINQSNKGENDIGEKGIGFKSVFMMASKAHIESKEYSFSFRRNNVSEPKPSRNTERSPLFLRHIKKLSIVDHEAQFSTITTSYEELEERGVLTREDGDSEPDVKHFHIFRQVFDEIPTEGKKRKNPNAEVKLAFPFTPDHKPLIERQPDVFARLPINSTGVGLHFLVHSDFSTSANREAVDEKSAGNAVLLGKIAEVFQVAAKHFSNDPCLPLRHQWMEFLPDHSISSTFWSALRVKIESALKGTLFLRSRSGRVRLISDLRYLPEMFRDSPEEKSNPLFLDLPDDEKYLHPDYEAQLQRLRTLGLKDLTPEEMVDRVERDVKSKLLSCMRTNVEDIWHTHVAMFFLFCRDNYPTEWARLQELPLIPLFPGGYHNWTSNSNADVYFTTVGNLSVPTDLNISLITADAASCPARKLLFTALRVKDAPFNLSGHNIGLESSLSHLRFLWWTHPKDYTDDSKLYRRLHVFNEKKDQLFRLSSEIFFCSDDSFGVRELFPEWLRDVIGVQEYPRHVDRGNPTELSPIFERISKDCPDRVVGLLWAHWCEYNKQISEPIRQKVSDVRVPYTTGDGTSGKLKLRLSDLPLPALKKACESFALDACYPFLTLPGEVAGRDLTGWDCLTFFGVNKELNLQFYLWILFFFKKLKGGAVQERAESCQSALKEVRCFNKGLNVFVPTSPGSFSWNAPEECLWDAPSYMRSKIPLLARYRSITDASVPTEFFQETLLIRNTTSTDLLEELEFIRRRLPLPFCLFPRHCQHTCLGITIAVPRSPKRRTYTADTTSLASQLP